MEGGIDIRLVDEPLNIAEAIAGVTCAEAGGIDVFIGTTRAEAHGEHGKLECLDYHAYPEMAEKELAKLAGKARGEWNTTRIVIWHRLGRVAVGEASVVIAVSCPHRADAFAACRCLIDGLKETAPIWKREVYEGRARWKGE